METTTSDVDDFFIDGLLDFPTDDINTILETAAGSSSAAESSSSSSSALPAADKCSGDGAPIATDFGVPLDDLAQLEWLSNFVEESFSDEMRQNLQFGPGSIQARPEVEPPRTPQYYPFHPDIVRPGPSPIQASVPAKARSKRSRAAPGNWTSRLLVVSPPPSVTTSSSDSSDVIVVAAGKKASKRSKKEGGGGGGSDGSSGGGEGRRCVHCATDKTPQWRTGPMGPKTLCNACGVRYKSGRLVPEYRPAASPTFVLAKHSNSHRKVLELRRQKEVVRSQHQQQPFMSHHHFHHHQGMIFDASSNGEDYLIHQHLGPDFRHLI